MVVGTNIVSKPCVAQNIIIHLHRFMIHVFICMETAEARATENGSSRIDQEEDRPGSKHGRFTRGRPDDCATWYIVVVISLRDTPPAPHCAACILFSFRFAIPHQRRCVRRSEGLHFASRYPTSPSARRAEFWSVRQNSARGAYFFAFIIVFGDRIRLVKLIFDAVEFL